MPNIKSAKKRVKVTAVKTLQNKKFKSDLKTAIKKIKLDLSVNKNADALKLAYKKLDKAVAKGILHKNTAARKKSALAATLNASV
ncbi:MAG: ribosomal protein [Clostridia bacterium]|nr:ribosomal protein [Clostridia bacterium]